MSKPRPNGSRAAVTNGKRLHITRPSGLTVEGRRFADLVEALMEERGGRASLDVGRQQAIRMYALLSVEREQIEAAKASGEHIDAEGYGKLCDRADRQFRRMGPAQKAAGLTLRQYSEALYGKKDT